MLKMEGFEIRIQRKVCIEEQMDLPVQIFYVVSGRAVVKFRNRVYRMNQEDLILVNGMEPYSLRTLEDAVICTVCMDYSLISGVTLDNVILFSLNSLEIPDRPYEDIREILRELVYAEVMGKQTSPCRSMSRLYELLDILLLHCPGQAGRCSDGAPGKVSDTQKLVGILSYVNKNYRDSLSLRELARTMYTSTSTLSRFFKNQTGHYFAEYLSRVRLAHAVTELTGTDRSITRVAMDCGFSGTSAFSRLFHETYGVTPQEYRRQQAEKTARREDLDQELRAILASRLEEIRPRETYAAQEEDIVIAAQGGVDFSNPWNCVLNMGSMSALTRANVQYHLLNMAKDLKMTHVKIWSVFTRDLRITDGKTKGSYNYSLVDTVLDMIVENQLAVYLDFGSRQDVIIGSMDNALIAEEVGIEFESRQLWEDLFEDFIRHLVLRYGREEIGRWIFDFCSDPTFRGNGVYYQDPDYDYQNVYNFAYRTIRHLTPGSRIGGPVWISNQSRTAGLAHFLAGCVEAGCVPDFVSVLLLPYRPDTEGGGFSRDPDPDFEIHCLKKIRGLIRQICGRQVPIYASDWNLSVSNRNVINDSCGRGVYLCTRAYAISRYVARCSIWVASDWVSNYFDTRSILSGGGGLLSRDNIRKPAYYAQFFLGELQGKMLYQEPRMIVTMKNTRSFRAVCSNRISFNVGYYLKEEEEITPENMDVVMVSAPACSFNLVIRGLEEGAEYVVRTRSVNRHYGSIQDEWKRFGYENSLTRDDVKYLRDICVPHLSMTRVKVQGGSLIHRIVLDEQEFQLLHIFQVNEIPE